MILDKSLIIYYNKINNSIPSLGIKKENIKNIKDNDNLKNILKMYHNNKKYDYFIYADSNIVFIKNNKNEWDSLEEYINTNDHDIYFMMKDKKNINRSFFIIKNNKNITSIINFYQNITKINYGTIPNQYVINGNKIYNEFKSLIHYKENKNVNPKIIKYKYEIVVARYNEDLLWLKDVPKDIKITIYNKGKDDISYPYISLPNIGRESHTYMYHIVNNYDNLADMTIFCQGESIFHSPDFINLLKNRKYFEPIQPLSAFFCTNLHPPLFVDVPPPSLLEETKYLHIKGNKIHVEYTDNDFSTKYPYKINNDSGFNTIMAYAKVKYNTNNILKFFINRLKIKNVDLTKLIPMCYSALFSVKKNIIQENSLDFYNNILNNIIYETRLDNDGKIKDHGFFLGYFLEKTWLLIFNYKKNNKNYLDLNVNDYLFYETNMIIKNNTINFNIFKIIFNETNNIFLHIYIDNVKYLLYIKKTIIIFYKQQLLIEKYINNDILKDMDYTIINISLQKNIIKITGNNVLLLEYTFNYNINKITDVILYDLSKENKFIDLNL